MSKTFIQTTSAVSVRNLSQLANYEMHMRKRLTWGFSAGFVQELSAVKMVWTRIMLQSTDNWKCSQFNFYLHFKNLIVTHN